MPKLLYEDITYKIRGACFSVYNELGSIREKTIEKALSVELEEAGLKFETQVPVKLHYKGIEIGKYIPDFVIEDKIFLELKSKPHITKDDMKQFWDYLKQSEYKLGLLVAFTPEKLIIKRYVYDEARNKKPGNSS
ncbi:MAG: GxxExxY protein [Candidatus Spechtbacterales bacterium]